MITDNAELIDTYFKYIGEWGNTKLAAEHCCVSLGTARQLEAKYPERMEEAMFAYREMLRGEVIKRIKDPEQYSEKLLLKELEMVDHRYRTKVEVQHNHSVELVGRLQRAKERLIDGGHIEEQPVSRMTALLTRKTEVCADNRAPMMADYQKEEEPKRTAGEIIDAEFSTI